MDCPENTANTTECLLRALLQAQSGYDWDPLNFAFTAAIGVLALVVAAITVFQGLLAAGPGRIKASREAIGPWADFSKTRFSWAELRLRTSTKTPFIKSISELIPDDKEDLGIRNEVRAYPARWRSLLACAGVSRERHILNDKHLPLLPFVEVDTDYLPSDIQAAPAWATVETVLQIAGLAGCNEFSFPSGSLYPEVRGPNAVLRFREHPDLGGIAIFVQFIRERIYNNIGSSWGRILRENLHGVTPFECSGISNLGLLVQGSLLRTFQDDSDQRQPSERNETCRTHHQCSAWFKLKSAGRFDDECRRRIMMPFIARSPRSPRFLRLSSERHLDTMRSIGNACGFSSLMEDMRGLAQLIFSDTDLLPVGAEGPGPLVCYQGDEVYTFPLAGTKYEKYDGELFGKTVKHIQMGWSWLSPPEVIKDLPAPEDLNPFATELGNDGQKFIIIKDFYLIPKRLMDGNLQFLHPINRADYLRTLLQLQLQEIDYWLHDHGGALAICQLRILVMDTAAFIEKNSVTSSEQQASASQTQGQESSTCRSGVGTESTHSTPLMSFTTNGKTPDSREILASEAPEASSYSRFMAEVARDIPDSGPEDEESEEKRIKAQERGMRAMLIFRAFIWTAYIYTAGDISFLDRTDIGNRVVQIL